MYPLLFYLAVRKRTINSIATTNALPPYITTPPVAGSIVSAAGGRDAPGLFKMFVQSCFAQSKVLQQLSL